MPLNVNWNGSVYTIPLQGDNYAWGTGTTAYLNALSSALSPSTSTFTLNTEVDMGTSFGLRLPYIRSASTNPAAGGSLRLSSFDSINWRNPANSADLPLQVNGSGQLTFNGAVLSTGGGTVSSVAISAPSNRITVSGSPITSSGTIILDVNQSLLSLNLIGGTLDLSTQAGGNLSVNRLNSGLFASSATFWRGDGTWATPPGGGTVSSVALSGGTTGLTVTGSPITTSGTMTLAGTLAIANGGTGQTTASTALNALFAGTTSLTLASNTTLLGNTLDLSGVSGETVRVFMKPFGTSSNALAATRYTSSSSGTTNNILEVGAYNFSTPGAYRIALGRTSGGTGSDAVDSLVFCGLSTNTVWATINPGTKSAISTDLIRKLEVGDPVANVGTLSIVQNQQNSSYTANLSDSGRSITKLGAGAGVIFTIPTNASVAFALGTCLTFDNFGANPVTIACADSLVWLPSGTTGNRTLAQWGTCVARKINNTQWVLTGTGLS